MIWHWQFDPIALHVGPLQLHWYGVLFALAFVLGQQLLAWCYRREDYDSQALDSLMPWALIGTVLGARLAHCLIYDPAYYLSQPLAILRVWEGGLASHGGALGLMLALWLYSRRHPQPGFAWLLDRIALPAALGGALVRCANFLNSEILGRPTGGDWGVVFAAIDPLPRHPVQLYEAGAYLLIAALLWTVYRRHGRATPSGLLAGLFLLTVFAARALLETLKTPQAAYESGFAVSVGQWLSLPLMALGLWLVWRAKRRA
jgi:prolipoprotein diacylglyceryl transferase